MKVYPIFLNDLSGRQCVVFGGNHEAERKVRGLLACDATVVVVSPEVNEGLRRLVDDGRLTWLRRDYEPGDLRDAFLAIVAETNPPRTRPIFEEALREKVLINAMDDVPHCTFIAGSIVRQGALVLAISTSGAAPALSVRLREEFEKQFGPEYATFLDWMAALRDPMSETYPDFDERRRIWYDLIDSNLVDLLRHGRFEEAADRLFAIAGEDVATAAAFSRRPSDDERRTTAAVPPLPATTKIPNT